MCELLSGSTDSKLRVLLTTLYIACIKTKMASGFPGKESARQCRNLSANAGDVGLIPELGRSPGEGKGNPL